MSIPQSEKDRLLEELKAFLRIPSISTLPENKPDILRAAEFVREALSAAGLNNAQLVEGDGNPLVIFDCFKCDWRAFNIIFPIINQ